MHVASDEFGLRLIKARQVGGDRAESRVRLACFEVADVLANEDLALDA
jgi:hypothetical protein